MQILNSHVIFTLLTLVTSIQVCFSRMMDFCKWKYKMYKVWYKIYKVCPICFIVFLTQSDLCIEQSQVLVQECPPVLGFGHDTLVHVCQDCSISRTQWICRVWSHHHFFKQSPRNWKWNQRKTKWHWVTSSRQRLKELKLIINYKLNIKLNLLPPPFPQRCSDNKLRPKSRNLRKPRAKMGMYA